MLLLLSTIAFAQEAEAVLDEPQKIKSGSTITASQPSWLVPDCGTKPCWLVSSSKLAVGAWISWRR